MADLLGTASTDTGLGRMSAARITAAMHLSIRMRLYCHRCNAVHEFPLAAVERIVYTLAADGADGWAEPEAVSSEEPACLREALVWSLEEGLYLEHADQGAGQRAAGEVTTPRMPLDQGDLHKSTSGDEAAWCLCAIGVDHAEGRPSEVAGAPLAVPAGKPVAALFGERVADCVNCGRPIVLTIALEARPSRSDDYQWRHAATDALACVEGTVRA
jgi:hypothetical protein